MANVLITGGAGYIGSHCVRALADEHAITVVDNLEQGHHDAVPARLLRVVDIDDADALEALFAEQSFDAVIHLAALSNVADSVADPQKYYQRNVRATMTLLETMLRHKVMCLVYSSSAAVYGAPDVTMIEESEPAAPINAYGRSKLFVEQILRDFQHAYGLRSTVLRYFNAAGAHPDGTIGERHDPETHLIPLALQVANGVRPCFQILGDDYDTHDGTCIRDFVHVVDIAQAHALALTHLLGGGPGATLNLGSGCGRSVRDVVRVVESVAGRPIETHVAPRRRGDPERLVASNARAAMMLGWSPAMSDLRTIVEHAWQWERQRGSRW